MREVILGTFGQYKLREDGCFFKKIYEHNTLGEVVDESWEKSPITFSKCDYRGGGYYVVSASMNKNTNHRIHRLVAKHFVKGFSTGLHVNHIDGDRANNHASNLEWVSHKKNMENAASRGVLGKHLKFSGKIDESKLLTIITLINSGVSNIEIAKCFDIDRTVISKIRNKHKSTYPAYHHLVNIA